MLSFRRLVMLWIAAACIAAGQPALSIVQDILYRADGMRFTGTMYITYSSFQAGDTSDIATANLIVPIVNGVLQVELVPTTTASAGAQYNITYNSRGVNQFTEIWAVPPSDVVLRVRDVRISQGTVVGPPPLVTPVQISDVVGLQNELAIRPMKGVGFAIGRTAIINQAGQIDGAVGNLSDCVSVDGSSGPCGTGGGGSGVLPSFSDAEIPTGLVNGANTTFALLFAPSPAASLDLYRNGLLMKQGADYSITGSTISFFVASTPQSGDLVQAAYRYANPNNPLGTLTAAEVICSGMGTSTGSTTLTQLGSCTIPAGLLGTGDRIELQFQYAHTGSAAGVSGQIQWGGTTVFSRSSVASETAVVGRIALGIDSGTQSWDAQSWGNSLTLANTVGSAGEDTTQNLTISFRGQMLAVSSDSVLLSNFTVIRYPAQTNP
jgi:hypothetical protein